MELGFAPMGVPMGVGSDHVGGSAQPACEHSAPATLGKLADAALKSFGGTVFAILFQCAS